ncbi:MAG TPA: DinB family protein [Bacilli bacterium]|nr:DinB family protein [Bacilli bacterium]
MSNISLFDFWEYYDDKTKGFLTLLTDEQLTFQPYPGMKTLGEELRHILDVRDLYLRAMTEGTGPSWKEKRMDPEMAVSIEKLRAYYNDLVERFAAFQASEIDWSHVVPWEGMGDPDVEGCLNFLIHFECTHQGALSVYIAGLGLEYDIAG